MKDPLSFGELGKFGIRQNLLTSQSVYGTLGNVLSVYRESCSEGRSRFHAIQRKYCRHIIPKAAIIYVK